MKNLDFDDLESLALGAAILGSGGGGATSINLLITRHMIEKHGPVRLLSVDELREDDLIVPVGFMGAPLVAREKVASGHEFPALFAALEKRVGRKATVLMAAEIGGANAFTPIWVGAMMGLPVLDADTIGRAFPELQMSSCTLHQLSPSPAFLADALGNVVTIESPDSHTVERIARQVTVAMGSRAALAIYLMDKLMAQKSTIHGTVSKAIAIGNAIQNARRNKTNPTEAVIKADKGRCIASGIITDVDHKIEGGFLKGKLIISLPDASEVEIHYQNEFLIAMQDKKPIAITPDIIMLMEQETGSPITSAFLQYGLRVDVVVLPSPEIWKTAEGLALVGPEYFGYKFTDEVRS